MSMCPMYTHVTPILQYIGPCNLNRKFRSIFVYNSLAISKWIYIMADLQQVTQYLETKY